MNSRIKKLTLSAICAALGVVMMYLGSLIEVLDLTTVFAASLLIVFLQIELAGAWPWLAWAVTSMLSILLLPNKFCAFEYAFFGGIYPLLKYYIEKLPRRLAYLLKMLAFNLLFAGVMVVSVWLYGLEDITLPVVGKLSSQGYFIILFALGNIIFVLFDRLLTQMIILYEDRWQQRVRRLFK